MKPTRARPHAYRPTAAQYDARVDRIIGMPGATRNNLLHVAGRNLDRIERRERSRRGAQEILAVCVAGMVMGMMAVLIGQVIP
jgi:hypothetical protein